jgi:hypothetical protein
MYQAAEAAVLTLVLAQGTFTASTCQRDNWRVMEEPGDHVCVIEQFGDTLEGDRIGIYGSQGKRTQQHEIAVQILTPIKDALGGDDTAVQASKVLAEALADYLALYERLNNTSGVQRCQVVRITKPDAVQRVNRGPAPATHIKQTIVLRVVTQESWTPNESSH